MSALYVQVPLGVGATLTAANTGFDGSGSSGTTIWPLLNYASVTGHTNGGWLDYLIFKPLATISTDTVMRIFISDDGSLGAPHCSLIGELLIPAAGPNPSNTVASPDTYIWYPPGGFGEMPVGAKIYVTETQASTIRAYAAGGLY